MSATINQRSQLESPVLTDSMWPWVKLLNLGTQKLHKIMAFWEWLILFTKVRYFVEKTRCQIDHNCLSSFASLKSWPNPSGKSHFPVLAARDCTSMEVFPFDHTMESLESGVFQHLKTGSIGIHWDPLGCRKFPGSGQGTSSWRRLVSRTLSSRNMWRSQIASKMGSSWMDVCFFLRGKTWKPRCIDAFIPFFVYLFILLFIWLFI